MRLLYSVELGKENLGQRNGLHMSYREENILVSAL